MDIFRKNAPVNGPGGWHCSCCGPKGSKEIARRIARRRLKKEIEKNFFKNNEEN